MIFLGFIVSCEGISLDPYKVQVIIDWSELKNIHEVHNFHRLVTFYRCSIKGFSIIISRIINYLKQSEFRWSKITSEAFEEAKKRMMPQ